VQRQLAQARASLTTVDPSLSNERTLR